VSRPTDVREWLRDIVQRRNWLEAENKRLRLFEFEQRRGIKRGKGMRTCAYCGRPCRRYACSCHMDLAEMEGRA
jgi:hypothetical protein